MPYLSLNLSAVRFYDIYRLSSKSNTLTQRLKGKFMICNLQLL